MENNAAAIALDHRNSQNGGDRPAFSPHKIDSQTMLSHELRTPLTTSLMILESLLNTFNLSLPARQLILVIISQINLILCLVNDMLDLKLMDEGKFVAK